MSIRKKVLLIILAILLIIQFLQPERNYRLEKTEADISNLYQMPESVKAILQSSCYDCHSNSTDYPWYTSIQPFGWFMAYHIREGKSELNFNEFGNYSARRQKSKLKSIGESIRNGSMPLSSYTLLHQSAKLSKEEEYVVLKWITDIQSSSFFKK